MKFLVSQDSPSYGNTASCHIFRRNVNLKLYFQVMVIYQVIHCIMMTHTKCICQESKRHSLVKSSMSNIHKAVLHECSSLTRNIVLCHDALHMSNTENMGQGQKQKRHMTQSTYLYCRSLQMPSTQNINSRNTSKLKPSFIKFEHDSLQRS